MVKDGPSLHEIRGMLKHEAHWINLTTPVDFWASAIPEGQVRFIVGLIIPGDRANTTSISFFRVDETGLVYTHRIGPIPVAAADMRQLPEGDIDPKNPIIRLPGGTNYAAQVDVAGTSLCVTSVYWDPDV